MIFGAVLVAVGFALSFTPAAVASPFLYKMGAAMTVGVVHVSASGTQGMTMDSGDSRKSYSFGSPINQSAAGNGVNLLFGKRLVAGVLYQRRHLRRRTAITLISQHV
ncbi:hypothetical protein [Enterobacter cloacae complex sp. 379K3]|uniref:hypothetical protein n=1 Tax=Enterobacter cloacae complex sp. 379K3 TaxID=3395865 RepID=UPI003CF11047